MYILLVVQSGLSSGRQVCLPRGKQVCVGRSTQADFAFSKDSFISGTHFLLENDDDTCWVTDLNSRNGTYVNGHRVKRSQLNDGDTIMAGHTVFSVQLKQVDSEIARDAAFAFFKSPRWRRFCRSHHIRHNTGTAGGAIPAGSPTATAARPLSAALRGARSGSRQETTCAYL